MQQLNQSQTELIAELARVRAELADHGRVDSFYDSLASSFTKYGSLTERQEAALRRSLAQYQERNARVVAGRKERVTTSPIPLGRVTIIGQVVSTKWVENQFGGALKMLVESEQGWRVYGTVPARLSDKAAEIGAELKGSKVAFTAQVQPKEADFGFFSRPTGGALLTEEQQPEALEPAPEAVPQPVAQPLTGTQVAIAHLETIVKDNPRVAPIFRYLKGEITAEQAAEQATAIVREATQVAVTVAKDLSPEDLLEEADRASGGLASEFIKPTQPRVAPLTGLAALVAAAGYTK